MHAASLSASMVLINMSHPVAHDCHQRRFKVSVHPQDLAQRAMVAYTRSVFLQPNHAIFDASALPLEDFALSMGLSTVPRLRFLARRQAGSNPAQTSDQVRDAICECLCGGAGGWRRQGKKGNQRG